MPLIGKLRSWIAKFLFVQSDSILQELIQSVKLVYDKNNKRVFVTLGSRKKDVTADYVEIVMEITNRKEKKEDRVDSSVYDDFVRQPEAMGQA